MATSDEFVNLAEKRLLSKDRLNTNFFEYLYEHTLDLWTSIFPAAGFFTYPVNIFIYAGTFDLIPLAPLPASPARGCDNAGHLLELAGATRLTNIPYENDSLSDYWIALHYAEIPSGVYPNPRTGINEFDKTKEEIGLRDYPDVVVDTGLGTVTFTVDSVCPSIAPSDYGGRDVWVWLRNPLSSDIGVALEHLTITWDGSNNKVTSVAAFGQSTISTVLTDYYVCLDGPCVYNAGADPTVNPYTDDYLLIGYIDDSGHTAIDESLQIDLSGGGGHSLQAAYNGLTGSGSGRDITIDDQAVLLSQQNTTVYEKDISQAVLRLFKDDNMSIPSGTTAPLDPEDVEGGIDAKMRLRAFASFMDRRNLMDVTGTDLLRGEEAIDTDAAADTITFTRGAPLDLTMGTLNVRLKAGVDLVEIIGSAVGEDGLYYIRSIPSATQLQLLNINGSSPSFTGEVAAGLTARIYRPNCTIGHNFGQMRLNGLQDVTADLGISNSFAIPLVVQVPASTANTDRMASFYRLTSGDKAYIRGDGGIHADGVIHTNKDMTVGGDFAYAPSQTHYANLGVEDAQISVISHANTWELVTPVAANSYLANITPDATSTHYASVVFPIHLGDGVSVTNIDLLCSIPPASNWATATFAKISQNYTEPAIGAFTTIKTATASESGLQNLPITPDVPEIIDNSTYQYLVRITAGDTSGSVVHGMRITYTVGDVRPIG